MSAHLTREEEELAQGAHILGDVQLQRCRPFHMGRACIQVTMHMTVTNTD
jgi:hypothetical protein